MSIFTFILGLIIGIGLMFGFEKYRLFRNEEEKRAEKMEEILVNWKAMEKALEEKNKN